MSHTSANEAIGKLEQDRRTVRRLSRSFLAFGIHPNPAALAENGTPAELAAFMGKVYRRMLVILALVIGIFSLVWGVTGNLPFAPTEPIFRPAGTVSSVTVQQSTSSVTTSDGIFQVRGAVTASVGDSAQLKSWTTGSKKRIELCINSQFKSACYPVR